MLKKVPKQVLEILRKLEKEGHEAYIVGGCVRDLIMNKEPKDWDITTSARPEKIQEIFPDSFYENDFGTVGVKTKPFILDKNKNKEHDVVEVTTFRIESKYSDKRRPDKVKFAETLKEDLGRRDFTVNAIALRAKKQKTTNYEVIDFFDGQKDIKKKDNSNSWRSPGKI